MSNFQVGIVVGIDKHGNENVYRMIAATATQKAAKQYDWNFNCKMLSEQQVIQSLQNNLKWINIKLEDGKVKGSAGALSRFDGTDTKPLVIISQLVDSNDRILGYKVADYNGSVKNIPIKEMIAYGNRSTKADKVPVQNAIFVPEENNKKAHFKSYPNCNFIVELVVTNKSTNTNADKPARVPLAKNEKTLNKLDEIYTKEQIAELRDGKKSGVDIRVYANPALSHLQMAALKKGLQKGVNVKPFASPEYTPDCMKWYANDLKNGIDIRKYLNPKYSLGQLSELSLAVEQGLDISKMSDVNKSPEDMAEIRERLEAKIWKDELVNKDGSWK